MARSCSWGTGEAAGTLGAVIRIVVACCLLACGVEKKKPPPPLPKPAKAEPQRAEPQETEPDENPLAAKERDYCEAIIDLETLGQIVGAEASPAELGRRMTRLGQGTGQCKWTSKSGAIINLVIGCGGVVDYDKTKAMAQKHGHLPFKELDIADGAYRFTEGEDNSSHNVKTGTCMITTEINKLAFDKAEALTRNLAAAVAAKPVDW